MWLCCRKQQSNFIFRYSSQKKMSSESQYSPSEVEKCSGACQRGLQKQPQMAIIDSKTETTSKVSLTVLNRINLRRRGWHAELSTWVTPRSPSSPHPTLHSLEMENLIPCASIPADKTCHYFLPFQPMSTKIPTFPFQ